jgi:hypothetical protein
MAISPPTRKPLGVRVTAKEHKLIAAAAKREHRSINSFVVQAALLAASGEPKTPGRSREEVDAIIRSAQQAFRAANPDGRNLVDELLRERREEVARG